MQIFELHFNPDNKKDVTVDSFCYRPENVYEKRLGTLGIAGELINTSSKNRTLINNLAEKIKGTYHALPTRSQEEALQEGLLEANNHLTNQAEKNNTSWSNDLNIAVFSIKNKRLQFSKIGNIKILLARNNQIQNIGKNAQEETEMGCTVFGSIVTGKIKKRDKLLIITEDVYQNLAREDLLEVFTLNESINEEKLEQIAETQKEKFPETIGACVITDFSIKVPAKEKKMVSEEEFSFKETFQAVLEESKKGLRLTGNQISQYTAKGSKKVYKGGKYLGKQSKKIFSALSKDALKGLRKINSSLRKTTNQFTTSVKEKVSSSDQTANTSSKNNTSSKKKEGGTKEGNSSEEEKSSEEKESSEKEDSPDKSQKQSSQSNQSMNLRSKASKVKSFVQTEIKKSYQALKRNYQKINKISSSTTPRLAHLIQSQIPEDSQKRQRFLLIGLLVFIILIGSFATHLERQEKIETQRQTLNEIEENVQKINISQENAFQKLSKQHQRLTDFINQGTYLEKDAQELKNNIRKTLLNLSNAQLIKEPEIVFDSANMPLNKLTVLQEELYLCNPFLSDITRYNPDTQESYIKTTELKEGGIFEIDSINSSLLLFSRPNYIITFDEEQVISQLESPYPSYSFRKLRTFGNYFYLLETKQNQIIRYEKGQYNLPQEWIDERKPGKIISFDVDGSVWILKEDNTIWKYSDNKPVPNSSINLEEIYPYPKDFREIKTTSELPLFLLEPTQNRIIIVSKEGEVIKQLIFPEMNNIKDFAVSSEASKIYLLSNQKVYSAELEL